ncbi:Rad4 beta-hairpin domain 3-domain-containing protein [Dunaliella salina]|uniref:Rad4 beta-hairpin domain 3-domain-containing protein n=1 Tax=Dunaliella salina TaxID=3046 RepID=A0ABQ7GXS0_DUNSA|nr:Rad4 beta-hairpin domain 3-domain-containing protein [Dunaliella salina]|eukprot:KAF5839400.1 Rad4 beta-hairpin domain 3-domain-containing protein [Dunaliella salina]
MEDPVQWEDLPENEEEVQTVSGEGLSDEDLVLGAAEDADKGRQAASGKVRKAITRAMREHAAMVHRSCALCLVGRALLYDKALQDEELQATLISHLEPSTSSLLDPEHETQRAINCLLPFLKWFRQQFQIVPPPASQDGSLDDFPYDAPGIHAQQKGKGGSGKGGDGSSKAGQGGKGKQAHKDLLEDHKPSKGKSKAGAKKQQQEGAGPSNREGEQAGGGKGSGGKKRGASSGAEETADVATGKRQRRGDDEFERQLQMAMIATQAEQAARQKLGPQEPSPAAEREGRGGSGGAGTSRAALTTSASVSHSATQSPAGKKGGVVVAAPDFASCWAEVWCGSPEYGRWVHVDVVATEVDRPQKVEPCAAASGTYAAAAGYVVACEEGVVRDVTTRYLTNTLAVKRLRDGPWWAATQQKLEQLAEMRVHAPCAPGPPEPTATIDLTSDVDVQEDDVKGGSTQQQGQDGPGQHQGEVHHHHQQQQQQEQQQEQQQHASEQRACRQASSDGAGPSRAAPASAHKSAHSTPASKQQDASASHPDRQRGSVPAGSPHQNQNGVTGSASGKASSSEKAGLGLPTSIEGFKAHPLYVLQRHITKYEVPRNERGSIEVPPFVASMPLGCVHLPVTGLGPICRSLDVDFAPALTGFELQSGRSVPRFEGIVVCEADEQRVMSVYLEREGAKQEAAQKQRMRAARTAWIQLLQALRTRMRLADSYQQPDEAGPSNAPKPGQQAAHAARMATDSMTK